MLRAQNEQTQNIEFSEAADVIMGEVGHRRVIGNEFFFSRLWHCPWLQSHPQWLSQIRELFCPCNKGIGSS